ncbi:MAG: hypothetical protein AAF845_01830 [Bacteroidota bacterium]
MRSELQTELDAAIRRLESFKGRAAAMLALGNKGVDLPRHLQFKDSELRPLDDSLIALVAQITQSASISAASWTPPVRYAYANSGRPSQRGQWDWLERFYDGLSMSVDFLESHRSTETGGAVYNVTLENSAGVAIGPGASVDRTEWRQEVAPDMEALIEDLALLRAAMKQEATSVEHDVAVGSVAAAEAAAREGDSKGVRKHLKAAGKWALDAATKIGVSAATEAIKASLKAGAA